MDFLFLPSFLRHFFSFFLFALDIEKWTDSRATPARPHVRASAQTRVSHLTVTPGGAGGRQISLPPYSVLPPSSPGRRRQTTTEKKSTSDRLMERSLFMPKPDPVLFIEGSQFALKGSIFPSVHTMSCQIDDIGCTEDKGKFRGSIQLTFQWTFKLSSN